MQQITFFTYGNYTTAMLDTDPALAAAHYCSKTIIVPATGWAAVMMCNNRYTAAYPGSSFQIDIWIDGGFVTHSILSGVQSCVYCETWGPYFVKKGMPIKVRVHPSEITNGPSIYLFLAPVR